MKKLLIIVLVLVVLVFLYTKFFYGTDEIGVKEKQHLLNEKVQLFNEKIFNTIKNQEPVKDFTGEVVAMVSKENNERKYGSFSEEMCRHSPDIVSRNSCWTGLAVMKNKIEYCDNIEGDKTECVMWVKKLKD